MTKYLGDDNVMDKVSLGFAKVSNGSLKGALRAFDGWLLRIVNAFLLRDMVKNPTILFSRKGFYALNYQCIVDNRK